MILVLDVLKDYPLEQTIYIEKRIDLYSVRLNLYRAKNPPGKLKLSVYFDITKIGESIINISDFFDIGGQDINSYFHGYVLFPLNISINTVGFYKFVLEGIDGYIAGLKQIGWIKHYERRFVPIYDPENFTDFSLAPHGLEIYDYKEILQ